jgi:hypothetical protein
VIGRVLRINGIVGELTFDNLTKASLEAQYKQGFEVSGGLKGEWTDRGTLKLTAPDTSFIAVQLWKFDENGFKSAAGQTFFQVVQVVPSDKAGPPLKKAAAHP